MIGQVLGEKKNYLFIFRLAWRQSKINCNILCMKKLKEAVNSGLPVRNSDPLAAESNTSVPWG